jgi:muramoyltetrapeptide carboxypeptidase
MANFRIGVVAPAARLDPAFAEQIAALSQTLFADRVEIAFHPQCFLSSGHFAGTDAERAGALIEYANDPSFNAIWFARGGYGSNRIAAKVLSGLEATARDKLYLGYSDNGFLLAGLYKAGLPHIAHGPMPADLRRVGGEQAVARALHYLVERSAETLEPSLKSGEHHAAFNLKILSSLIGSPLQPDLSYHVLMLEDVDEYHYAIDRTMFHVTSDLNIRKAAGIRAGRFSAIPENDPPFGAAEEEIVRHWCGISGIPYLGRADIGHDIANKIVPFGLLTKV